MIRETDDDAEADGLIEVLVVEDHQDSREVLAAMLKGGGCRVRTAVTAEEARLALADRVPDLILSDLRLGSGATGWTLAEELRADPRTKHVPLVAVSGEPLREDIAPFDAYVVKPIELDALRALVQRLAGSLRDEREYGDTEE